MKDAVTDYVQKTVSSSIKKFMVAGASKRGLDRYFYFCNTVINIFDYDYLRMDYLDYSCSR